MKNNELRELLREINGKIVTLEERRERGERFSKYMERFSLSPSLIVNYKPTAYPINITEREICAFKNGGYGAKRSGFLSDSKAKDFVDLISVKFPDYPLPRLEYLTCKDEFMTEEDLLKHLQEIDEEIKKYEKKIEALKKKKEAFKKQYLQDRD